jgi:hypothetical protein
MLRYKDFKPTQFDRHIEMDSREKWFVAPVSINRDSQPLAISNFEACKKILEDKQIEFEEHRFGHWANGWFEIILVSPDGMNELKSIEESLNNYPVLDEMDLSEREYEDSVQTWNCFACKEFKRYVVEIFSLGERSKNILNDIDNEILRGWHANNSPYDYEMTGEGSSFRFDNWCKYNPERTKELSRLLWNQKDGKNEQKTYCKKTN